MRSLTLVVLLATTLLTQLPLTAQQIDVSRIDIVRDEYGVPHIFAPTDEEVAYGLAWATCEDDFKTVQELLLGVKCKLATVKGKDGAVLDFLYQAVGVDRYVEEQFDEEYTGKFRKVLDYYAQGLNDYAEAYPKELLRKDLFPITSKDLVKSYTFTMSMLTSVYTEVIKIMKGNITDYEINLPDGSNAFAFNKNKTTDGNTYLAVNSHQPMEGLFSWYEAHVCSEEGWNMLGGTFPGGALIFLGTNEHLGWANTLNHPDLVDVYKLEMNPKEKHEYKFDDEWLELEVIPVKLKVKLGFLKIPVKKKVYWSKYGPTLKSKEGEFYSLRFPAQMEIGAAKQLYAMNKATNLEEFLDAMKMQEQAGVNTIYADRKSNIYFLSNGLFPYRSKGYDWLNVLPGNTSETLWEPKWHPFEELPQYLNPKAGYLYNTNNSPFLATGENENIDPYSINPTFGYLWEDNNRSIRTRKLIAKYDKISYQDFKDIKYDRMFDESMYTYGCENLGLFLKLDAEEFPDLKESIDVIQQWNYSTDVDNEHVAIMLYAFYNIVEKITSGATQYECNSFSKYEYAEALREAQKLMKKKFGSVQVRLGDVQKHARGDVELPVGGAPDVIAANMTKEYKKGMRRSDVGDSYIMMLQYAEDGVKIETVNAYGASNDPESPHYTDQMQMYVDQELKPMTLDKEEIYSKAKIIYHPTATPVEPKVTAGKEQ